MSRRSLRLQTSAGLYDNGSLADYSQNHSSSYTSTRRETRTTRSKKQQSSSGSLSLSLSQAVTPRKTLSFTAMSTPINSSSSVQESIQESEASLLTPILDQSHLRQRSVTTTTTTTSVDGHWGKSHRADHSSSSVNGDASASTSKSHASLHNGYICKDCSLHSQKSDSSTITQTSSSPLSSQAAVASSDAFFAASSSSSSSPFTSIYSRDRSRRNKTGYCLLQPGYCVVRAGKALGSGAGTVLQRLLSVFWMLLAAPVKAGRGLLWFLANGWYQLVSLMSLLNVFFLTRILPQLWKLLLLLIPLLLLLAWWFWGPSTAALLAYLPGKNLTEWRPVSAIALLSNLWPASAPAPNPAPVPAVETPFEQTPSTPVSQAPPILPPVAVSGVDLERLERVEQQLALLWERVKQGDQTQEQRHGDVLGLYGTLREQLQTQTDKESLGLWVSSLLEQRLGVLRAELEQENTNRAQSEEQQKQHQESHALRLAEVELLLRELADKTEKVQKKQQQYENEKKQEKEKEVPPPAAAAPDPVSVGVKQEDHDALLVEVQRLEVELGKIRQDLQGVLGCKGKCEQLETLQDTISAQVSSQVSSQVRKELQALFFGSGGSEQQQGEVPESLVLWLSQRYVSTPDLQALLASLEMNILKNVSLQLEQNRAQTLGEAESKAKSIVQTVTGSVKHSVSAEGMSEEHVKLIVQNALRLYSQDRTGLVDYALESGGGSILSTRCSETYETKTALMSLFGLPLWYFSQSPRVVIQPDVYPGNCWAFKGSQGYLVIRLSLRILPTSFCLEHIPKALSPTGNITSAPQNFTVYGLDDEYQEEGKLLGHYTYQEDGESLQSFPVMEQNDKSFQIIEVRVLSNWGHPEYTCLYRFRVHGEPRPQ
ncbi:SUN domain-containing protein 1 isoform X4 [Xyrichtys novacula]|uniref:SUN domain-containing protein 1 isoform X4 n=1 Tax=Xyrichtys novacula TaxID=13765 RepID=A0AAV1GNA4_XYRNO|nr:SUN domain-containing protein 1 isoform X4 [Xyrichtys novacula]